MATSKPPFNSVRVGHRTYKLELETAPLYYEGNEVSGLCCKHKGIISIVRGDVEFMKATLWHEIFHAIFNEQGIAESDDEERTVSALERGYMQVILDNPELMKWTMQ